MMKLIIALAAVLTSAALTVPTVSGPYESREVAVAFAGTGDPKRA